MHHLILGLVGSGVAPVTRLTEPLRFGNLEAEADDEKKRKGEQELFHGVSFTSKTNVTLLEPDREDSRGLEESVSFSCDCCL